MRSKFSDRQIQIIQASIKLIGTKGIQGLTTKNLAEAVAISEPALYRHFANKMEIIGAVLDYLRFNVQVKYAMTVNMNISSEEKLKELIRGQVQIFINNPPIVTVVLSDGMYKNEPELCDTIFTIMNFVIATIKKIIQQGQKEKHFRNDITAESMAFIILGSLRLTVTRWSLSGFKSDLKKDGEKLIKTILKLIK
jgi:AcrR family transcriptional regulator